MSRITAAFTVPWPNEDHVRAMFKASTTKTFALPTAVAEAVGLNATVSWRIAEFEIDRQNEPHTLRFSIERGSR